MENAAEEIKDGGSTDMISNLPEGILYTILFFLTKTEAARTCVLSKRWGSLWTNRLKLSYDERSSSFDGPHRTRLFTSHVTNALAHTRNHRVEELRLFVTHTSESILHFEEWIPMLAATRHVRNLFIFIVPEPISKLQECPYVDLPSAVFKSDCLKSLNIYRCNLSLQNITTTKAHFSRLKSLRLYAVKFADKHVFDALMRSCPYVTTMLFKECEGLKTVTLGRHKYLRHFTFINHRTQDQDRNERIILIRTPTLLQTIDIVGSRIQFLGGHRFSNLKILSLEWIDYSRFSFDCSSSYVFPLLETLTFKWCHGWPRLDQMLNITAPKLVRFLYVGRSIPSLTFATSMSRQCISEIRLRCRADDPQTWFVKLSGLLHALGQSEILFRVYQLYPYDIRNIDEPYIDNIIIGGDKLHVEVELLELTIGHLPSSPRVLNRMFTICRPRKIGHVRGGESQNELTEFLCNFLMKKSSDTEFSSWKEELEEVTIESFDADTKQWEPAALLPESEKRIRFQLKWSEDAKCEEEEEDEEESSSKCRRKFE